MWKCARTKLKVTVEKEKEKKQHTETVILQRTLSSKEVWKGVKLLHNEYWIRSFSWILWSQNSDRVFRTLSDI